MSIGESARYCLYMYGNVDVSRDSIRYRFMEVLAMSPYLTGARSSTLGYNSHNTTSAYFADSISILRPGMYNVSRTYAKHTYMTILDSCRL